VNNIPWAKLVAVVAGLAGVAGAIITPLYGTALAGEVQAVLEAISGILVIVSGGAATTVAVHAAKLANIRKDAKLGT
jgi:ABC-type branched-subunit amino acid transport system permease subunit